MKTGMIIIHYNDYESLSSLIDNIKNYQVLDKIVIVDNNSDNKIKEKLKRFENDKIKVIYNESNKGFSYAINTGAKYLDDYNLIISNCDIKIEKEEDIVSLVKYLSNKDIGVVAPTIIENNSVNRGWKNPSPLIDALMNIVYIHRKIRKKYVFYRDNYYHDKISYVDVVSGCFFLVKSSTLKEVNYLDENVFLYYEENILASKIKNINKKIIVVNDIDVVHNHSVSIDKNINKIKKLKIQKKSQYYYQTTYNKANVFEKILLRLTAFISRMILSVLYIVKDLIKR